MRTVPAPSKHRKSGTGQGGIPPVEPGLDVIVVNVGTVNANGQLTLSTATQTELNGDTIGAASTLTNSDIVYLTLANYNDDSIIGGIRVWIDHPSPATLSVWDPNPVQGQANFVRFDGTAPYTLTATGGGDLIYGWDVKTDPTGANDPSFNADASHRIDVQIQRGDSDNCDVPWAGFAIATDRATGVVPDPPTGVGSTAIVNGATITWVAGANAATYEIGITPTGGIETIFTDIASPYTAAALAAGVVHSVRVRSVSADGSRSLTWAAGPNFTPTAGGGFLPTRATGQTTTQTIRRRSTNQGNAGVYNATYHCPLTMQLVNNSQKVTFGSNMFLTGLQLTVDAWDRGLGTVTSTVDGPFRVLLIAGLSWGQNSRYVNNNNLLSFERMAEAANGLNVAAIRTGVTNLFNSTIGPGAATPGYWLDHTCIRLGWELGGQWNPVFPGTDEKLPTQLGTVPSNYSAAVKAAWQIAKTSGNRFPMFKIAWDLFCTTVDTRCEELCDAAGVNRRYVLFCANLASGNADPGTGDGPGTEWVPQCVTEVERHPDIIGWDFYGRGTPKPTLTGAADGNPIHYNWATVDAELDIIRDLCLETGLPLAMMEYGSTRRRDKSAPAQETWADHYRAAFWAYVNDWLDTGCGGAGVPIWLINHFFQQDCATSEYNNRVGRNMSYEWETETSSCTPDPPAANSLEASPLVRAEMLNWFSPAIIPN